MTHCRDIMPVTAPFAKCLANGDVRKNKGEERVEEERLIKGAEEMEEGERKEGRKKC